MSTRSTPNQPTMPISRSSSPAPPNEETPALPAHANNDATNDPTNSRKRKTTHEKDLTLADCHACIDNALAEKRITNHKALRLRACLNSDSLTHIIYQLLCEQIPNKRSTASSGEGYKCKICAMPLKGHVCPYCPVCSTPEKKFAKDGGHTCFNCPQCFEAGKRRKKVVQVLLGVGQCPHGAAKGDAAAAALIDMRKGYPV